MTLSPWPSSPGLQVYTTMSGLSYAVHRSSTGPPAHEAGTLPTDLHPQHVPIVLPKCTTEANIGLLYEPCLWGENAIPAHMFHPDFSSPGTIAGRLLVFASRSPNKKHVLFLCGLSPLGKLFYWFSQLEKEALMFVSVSLLQPCVLLTCLFPKELYFIWGSICISYVDLYFI